ncbi:amidohydrolase family-domain-containing protein [Pisolithus orientalis]|uniref:amidohydrolase family-domain-containing protein n=1 Tax=Pisolithus orientalis TaxID=936130 RepID=UPI0022241BE2|nr:amidohydrolase family-domain-containing protein [Pisolithus orientalis]KAI6032798.1 amidohydrolase family-domain-containing protein [Pisolithus orientalis]
MPKSQITSDDSIVGSNQNLSRTRTRRGTEETRKSLVLLISLVFPLVGFFHLTISSHLPKFYAVCSREGAKIYTVDDNNTVAQCLVVDHMFIVDTGSLEDVSSRWIAKLASPLSVRYIKRGSIIVPGLTDSHAHILEYGASRQLFLGDTKSVEEIITLVRQHISVNADMYDNTSFIEGWGWDHLSWSVKEWPTADAFESDLIVRDRAVVLQSKDGHALWLSKRALELSAPLPREIEGGVIFRRENGEPTGVLLDSAQSLVKKPGLTERDLLRHFTTTIDDALSLGLTSIHDAGYRSVSLAFFERQAAKAVLPIRIYGMRHFDEKGSYHGNLSTPIINAGNGRLNVRSVKIFADGALRSGGAALCSPYWDNPEKKGFMRIEEQLLHDVVIQYLLDGWQINVHAIGDCANRAVLDAFEDALQYVNVSALRPRLEHAQILTPEDVIRVGRLGVIASVQPTHVTSDMWYAEERLGPERVKGLYAFRSLHDNGGILAFGSDFPVEDMNPLAGFFAAITRLSPDGTSPKGSAGWFPEQRLSREQALRGMTINAAHASFAEDRLGSIVPGKLADFVVLSQNIMTIPIDRILKTKVLATVIDGRPVYGYI